MKKLSVVIVLVVLSVVSFAKSKTTVEKIKGKVIELADGQEQPVAMAFIYIDQTVYSAYTDDNGEFELELPKGKHEMKISFKGYAIEVKTIDTKKDNNLTVKLNTTNLASK